MGRNDDSKLRLSANFKKLKSGKDVGGENLFTLAVMLVLAKNFMRQYLKR